MRQSHQKVIGLQLPFPASDKNRTRLAMPFVPLPEASCSLLPRPTTRPNRLILALQREGKASSTLRNKTELSSLRHEWLPRQIFRPGLAAPCGRPA